MVEEVPNMVTVTEHKHEHRVCTETKMKMSDVYVAFQRFLIRML